MNQSMLWVVSTTNSAAWSGLHGPGFFFLSSCSVGVVGGISSTISRSPSCSVAIMMLVQLDVTLQWKIL